MALFGLNHWVSLALQAGDYTPFSSGPTISALVWDETQLYTPGPCRFSRDWSLPCEMDIYELRDAVNGYPILHSLVLGAAARLLGSLEWAWMLSHAVAPACLWLAAYGILGAVTPRLVLRSAVAWGMVLFALGPRNSLLLGTWALSQPLEATRMPHPALSLLTILGTALFARVALTCDGPKWIKAALAAGLTLGLTFYAYYFYWVAGFLGLGALLAVCVVVARPVAYRLALILAVGGAVGAPYVWRVLQAQVQGTQHPLLERVGSFHRTPYWTVLALALVATAGLVGFARAAWARRCGDRLARPVALALVLLALLVGGLWGINLHVLTGYEPQHGHFWNRLLQPVAILLAGAALAWGSNTSAAVGRVVSGLAVVGAAGVIGLAAYRQVTVARITGANHRASTPRYQVLTWLRDAIPGDRVVGTLDLEFISMLPGVAGQWVFVPNGDRTMATREEILARIALTAHLEGWSWPDLRSYLETPRNDLPAWQTPYYLHFLYQGPSQDLVAAAEQHYHSVDLSSLGRTRRLDYLILPASRSPDRLLGAFSEARVAYANADWVVFAMQPEQRPVTFTSLPSP
jgi:hypothetical protein